MPPRHRGQRLADRLRRRDGAQADPAGPRAGRAVLRPAHDETVWYAGYGSNLSPDRFGCYLAGGCPPGATRTYPGAREPDAALAVRPVGLPGRVAFAWESPTWGGGIAFYDPEPAADGVETRVDRAPGDGAPQGAQDGAPDGGTRGALATAYLVTGRQLSDVLAQEMWRAPGDDLDLAPVLAEGRQEVGPGRYETLHLAGTLEDRPVLTFSAPDVEALGVRAPAAAYLHTMAGGLREAHGLAHEEVVDYLLGCPGIGHDRPTLDHLLTRRESAPEPR